MTDTKLDEAPIVEAMTVEVCKKVACWPDCYDRKEPCVCQKWAAEQAWQAAKAEMERQGVLYIEENDEFGK